MPKLAIVRVGENPDDMSYERGAIKKMENFGLQAQSYEFPENISHEEFWAGFQKINQDPGVTGILLLKPLPKQIQEKEIDQLILPEKTWTGFLRQIWPRCLWETVRDLRLVLLRQWCGCLRRIRSRLPESGL